MFLTKEDIHNQSFIPTYVVFVKEDAIPQYSSHSEFILSQLKQAGDIYSYQPYIKEDNPELERLIAPYCSQMQTVKGGNLTNPPADYTEPADWMVQGMVSWRTPIVEIIPYGLDKNSYVVSLSRENIQTTGPGRMEPIDPKMAGDLFKEDTPDEETALVICPSDVYVVESNEVINHPRELLVFKALDDYDRSGLVTTLIHDTESKGVLKIRLQNPTSNSVKVYLEEGIGRLYFMKG